MLPDPEFYQQCLSEAFAELKASTLSPGSRAPA
jgi:hypothetical protein